ncbi:Zinc finger protein 619, partial [Galemys pyrenaicus]
RWERWCPRFRLALFRGTSGARAAFPVSKPDLVFQLEQGEAPWGQDPWVPGPGEALRSVCTDGKAKTRNEKQISNLNISKESESSRRILEQVLMEAPQYTDFKDSSEKLHLYDTGKKTNSKKGNFAHLTAQDHKSSTVEEKETARRLGETGDGSTHLITKRRLPRQKKLHTKKKPTQVTGPSAVKPLCPSSDLSTQPPQYVCFAPATLGPPPASHAVLLPLSTPLFLLLPTYEMFRRQCHRLHLEPRKQKRLSDPVGPRRQGARLQPRPCHRKPESPTDFSVVEGRTLCSSVLGPHGSSLPWRFVSAPSPEFGSNGGPPLPDLERWPRGLAEAASVAFPLSKPVLICQLEKGEAPWGPDPWEAEIWRSVCPGGESWVKKEEPAVKQEACEEAESHRVPVGGLLS